MKARWLVFVGALTLLGGTLWLTTGWWTVGIARSLVCVANRTPSDAILVDNFDPNFLLFERARTLRRIGVASRVLVRVRSDPGTLEPNAVAKGIVEVMARIARIGSIEIISTREVEPITLNAARDLKTFLEREHIRSVTVVTPLFRSRRSALIYSATFGSAGIAVRCEPVEGGRGIHTWTRSWHGIQEVAEQLVKLEYYRLYVLPFKTADVSEATSTR